jgi:hypothetical protein
MVAAAKKGNVMNTQNSNENENAEAPSSQGKRPTHAAYWVRSRDNKKSEWRPIGVAWENADGKGFNIALDLIPFDGRISVRLIENKPK